MRRLYAATYGANRRSAKAGGCLRGTDSAPHLAISCFADARPSERVDGFVMSGVRKPAQIRTSLLLTGKRFKPLIAECAGGTQVMTQMEIEAELGSLREHLLRLEQEQDRKEKEWGKLGRISLGAALGFCALSLGFLLLDSWFHYVGISPLPVQAFLPFFWSSRHWLYSPMP
jgi:hypothetical protein